MMQKGKYILSSVLFASFLILLASTVSAEIDEERIDELRQNIDDRTSKIEALEEEIRQYEQELEEVGEEKASLQGAIRSLELSQGKIEAEQNITRNRVSATTFEISKLALEITDKERRIVLHTDTLAESLRHINEVDDRTFVETMLSHNTLSDLWEEVEDIQQFQTNLRANLSELRVLKEDLEGSKSEQEGKRRQLINYDQELVEQDRALEITKNEKGELLTKTQNEESNYLSLLEEKRAARAEFERELLDFESQLQFALDPNSIPNPSRGVLSWPVENVRITQTFGDTEFARSGAYNGKGHNGVDFGLPTGSRVKAALSGTVVATGNTDAIAGCYSYGKWMLLRHNNGLSTLYAHLSGIALPEGTSVITGQTIGYSGNTGYSTGPHLHFTLFATQGVQIVRFGDIKAITNCADAYVPVAPHAAYLDPLSYLEE